MTTQSSNQPESRDYAAEAAADTDELWAFMERTLGTVMDRDAELIRAAYWLGMAHSGRTEHAREQAVRYERSWNDWGE